MLESSNAIIIVLSLVCLTGLFATLFLVVKLRRSNREIRNLLDNSLVTEDFTSELNKAEAAKVTSFFDMEFFEVETKKRLKEGFSDRQVPEKYRYAPCLLKRGLKNDEIAEILNLSCDEVDQIAKLTHIVLQAKNPTVH